VYNQNAEFNGSPFDSEVDRILTVQGYLPNILPPRAVQLYKQTDNLIIKTLLWSYTRPRLIDPNRCYFPPRVGRSSGVNPPQITQTLQEFFQNHETQTINAIEEIISLFTTRRTRLRYLKRFREFRILPANVILYIQRQIAAA